ncbi:MAG TPA: addiction module antidote protein, HigA family [Spirochaeta sp.]|nr:addiction module antidote protein, HigA family [Spirochaeta sp.]
MEEKVEYSDELIELTTPGEVLKEDFLEAMGLSAYELAKSIGVDPMRISRIIKGTRKITADTAIRLSKYFGTSAEYWINLQSLYDLDIAKEKNNKEYEKIHPTAS